MGKINTKVGPIQLKDIQSQCALADEISLANLHHGTELGHTLPAGMQEFTGERVEDDIDSLSVCGGENIATECDIARVEDSVAGNSKVVNEMLDLVLCSNSAVYLNVVLAINT